jgi:hypothetical protein
MPAPEPRMSNITVAMQKIFFAGLHCRFVGSASSILNNRASFSRVEILRDINLFRTKVAQAICEKIGTGNHFYCLK